MHQSCSDQEKWNLKKAWIFTKSSVLPKITKNGEEAEAEEVQTTVWIQICFSRNVPNYQIFPDSRKMESKESTSFYAEFFFAQNHKERRGRRKEAAAEEQETEAEDNDEDEDDQANLLQSEDFYHQESCTDAQNSGSALCSNCKKKKKKKKKKLSLLWRSFVWLSYRILKPCPSRGVKVERCSSSPLPWTPSCACRRSLYLAAVAAVVLVARFLHNNCKRQQQKTTHRDTYSFDWNSKCHAPPDPGNTLDLCTHLLMCWSLQVNMLFPAMSAFLLLLKKLQHLRRNYLRRRHNEP